MTTDRATLLALADRTANRWNAETFYLASTVGDPVLTHGYTYRGLALSHSGWRRPRSKTMWTLTHVGSGARVTSFIGDVLTVFPVASEFADCSNWEIFDMPDGWKNTDPELHEKVKALCEKHAAICAGHKHPHVTAEMAQAVISAREAIL